MSDSVDRVFVHALQTVRRLTRTGSSRPPPSDRLRLYGLYKQSMEGDVLSILPRPTLPPSSPDSSSSNVHKYASRDLRAREAQAEIEKWDAWHACAGMSRTDAKRRYITTLIETMKQYASGTLESRELVSDLEFVWSQIRSQSGSEEELGSSAAGRNPAQKAKRTGRRSQESYASLPPGRGSSAEDGGGGAGGSRLRVLSPVGSGGTDHIIEGEDVDSPNQDADADAGGDEEEEEEEEFHDSRDGSEGNNNNRSKALDRRRPTSPLQTRRWRRTIEAALIRMTTEIAALREQMSESKLFTSTSSSTRRRSSSPWLWMKWLVWATIRHAIANLVLLLVLVLWGRWRGDRRAEEWAQTRWKWVRGLLERFRRMGFEWMVKVKVIPSRWVL